MADIPEAVKDILVKIKDIGVRNSLKLKLVKICYGKAVNVSYTPEELAYLQANEYIFTEVKNLMLQCMNTESKYTQYCYES